MLAAGTEKGWQTSVQRLTPTPLLATNRARAFIDRSCGGGEVLHAETAETAQSALTVVFKLGISGLTNTILVVLGTVNFQLQGQFVTISLRPIPGYSLVIM